MSNLEWVVERRTGIFYPINVKTNYVFFDIPCKELGASAKFHGVFDVDRNGRVNVLEGKLEDLTFCGECGRVLLEVKNGCLRCPCGWKSCE
jgi:hypothetical protein